MDEIGSINLACKVTFYVVLYIFWLRVLTMVKSK